MKKYLIKFWNGQIVPMQCLDGIDPRDEVAKWNNSDLSKGNIVSIQEVESFEGDLNG